jgi:hypothetical protein
LAKRDSVSVTPPRYRAILIEGHKSLMKLKSELGEEGLALVLKINRRDLKHVRQGETLVVPEMMGDITALSPFPPKIEVAESIPKLLLVSRRVQAFGAYEFGQLIRWGPTSTGKKATPTPPGLYHTNWKSKERTSTFNEEWVLRWYFNLDSVEGISFHQYDLPGHPASHACIRLLEEDAQWIYNWADQWVLSKEDRSIVAQGTPVIVFGDYSFATRPPWKRLLEDPAATAIPIHEIEEALRPSRPTILERAQARESLLAPHQNKKDTDERR